MVKSASLDRVANSAPPLPATKTERKPNSTVQKVTTLVVGLLASLAAFMYLPLQGAILTTTFTMSIALYLVRNKETKTPAPAISPSPSDSDVQSTSPAPSKGGSVPSEDDRHSVRSDASSGSQGSNGVDGSYILAAPPSEPAPPARSLSAGNNPVQQSSSGSQTVFRMPIALQAAIHERIKLKETPPRIPPNGTESRPKATGKRQAPSAIPFVSPRKGAGTTQKAGTPIEAVLERKLSERRVKVNPGSAQRIEQGTPISKWNGKTKAQKALDFNKDEHKTSTKPKKK